MEVVHLDGDNSTRSRVLPPHVLQSVLAAIEAMSDSPKLTPELWTTITGLYSHGLL
jgi:hypothetical protein